MDLSTILLLLPTVVSGAAVIASAISKLTANKADDQVAAWLVAVHDLLVKFVPSGATLADKRTPTIPMAQAPVVHSK